MKTKPFYKSKLFWLGFLTFIASVLSFSEGQEFIKQNPSAVSAVGAALGFVTVVIRYLTDTAVSITGKARK